MNRSTTLTDTGGQRPPMDRVVPFSVTQPRRFRRPFAEGEALGRILLFTGVRYERIADDDLTPGLPKRRRS